MKTNLLLSLGLLLVSALHAHHTGPEKQPIDTQQLSGKWNSILMASSDPSRTENGGDMDISIKNITVNDSTVTFNMYLRQNGECVPLSLIANKAEKNNLFKVEYGGTNDIYLEELKGNEYALFCTHNIQNDKETLVMELYGRKNTLKEKVKKHFKDLCEKRGIDKENIIDMTKSDHCRKGGE